MLRRTFSVFNRVPTSRIVQSAARDGHESITVHRVRIRKPFLSRQRLVGAVAIATATYGLGRYLGIEVEIEEEEVEEKKLGRWKKQVRNEDGTLGEVDDKEANDKGDEEYEDEDEDEEEYDDAVLFLPTGLSRQKPKTYYRGSDPEWQEFKKISQDKARIERIRQELINLVRTSCSSPAYIAKIGEVDPKRGRAWIEFKYPDGPPPEFERPGYELTEDLEWRQTTRDVEPAHHHRITNLLSPTAAAAALYEDTKRKAGRSWNTFAAYIGWADQPEHLTVQQIIQQATNTRPPSSPSSSSTATASTTTSPFTTTPPTSSNSSNDKPPEEKALTIALPDPKTLTLDLTNLRDSLAKSHRQTTALNTPRGAFGVHALVEVWGSRARITLNVTAVYDPKQARFVALSVNLWNQVALRQTPKGGP